MPMIHDQIEEATEYFSKIYTVENSNVTSILHALKNESPFEHLFELGFELAFSCIILVLLVTVVMHMRIKYGDMVVTRRTTVPYKVAYAFLTVAAFECLTMLVLANIIFKDEGFQGFLDFLAGNTYFKFSVIFIEIIKVLIVS